MKVVEFTRFGPPEQVVDCIDVAEPPAPAADEVLLDVLAFPVDPADVKLIEGRYSERPALPARVGAECIARVIGVGSAVTELREGDLVMPFERENWAQRKLAKAARVMKLPAGIDPLQMCMLKLNPASAHLMMTKYVTLKPGDWLLQDAANSGVGRCVIQLARAAGLKTVNIVRREGLAQELAALGADVVLVDGDNLAQRITAATKGAPIKLAIDAVSGAQIVRFGDALADGATIVNYSDLSRQPPQMSSYQCIFKRLCLTGFGLMWWLQTKPREELVAIYSELAARIADGSLFVPIHKMFPIEQIKEALTLAKADHRSGKILILPNGRVG